MPPSPVPIDSSARNWTTQEADAALGKLLQATIDHEKAVALRDGEILKIQQKHAKDIDPAAARIAALQSQLQQFFAAERERRAGLVELKLSNGVLGITKGTTPALAPLNDKWTWKKIAAKLRRTFKAKFFHAPNPPELDKNKIKKELSAEQLAAHGLKLEYSSNFYIELNRLPEAA